MKRGLETAFVFIGLVIGAGFASGREIMEYFNFPSRTDHSGVVLATFLLICVCYVIMYKAYRDKIYTFDSYIGEIAGPLYTPVKIFMFIYLYCGFFTMLSGSGALLSQNFMVPSLCGIVLMALISFGVLSFDLKGIVAANTVLVPCLIAGVIYICINSVIFNTQSVFSMGNLTRGTILSAICYVSYNTVSAASVLVPLSRGIKYKEIRIAAVTGGFVLGLLILIIWTVQSMNFDKLWDSEIPMLKLAAMSGKSVKNITVAVLFMAISTTAISQGFGILGYFRIKSVKSRIIASAILCLSAIPFALIKFSDLVAHLYNFFGIAGLFWMGAVFYNYFFSP